MKVLQFIEMKTPNMNPRILLLLPIIFLSFTEWRVNLDDAKRLAKQEHKHILLNFSGSDWCGPCIRLHKEIFESEAFLKMADTALLLVNADFPRMKKNRLTEKQQALNDAVAERYNISGKFPLTLLLTSDGKVLKEWEGFPSISPEAFSAQVQDIVEADK
jgi:thioredoxin-related protein